MRDVIDREAIIEEIKSYIINPHHAISEHLDDIEKYNDWINVVINVLKIFPSAREWTLVREQPPEPWELVIVSGEDRGNPDIDFGQMDEDGEWYSPTSNIKAWMPTPKPYQEKSGENDFNK